MRNVSDKICVENQNIFYFQYFFFSENRAVCEIKWKNMVEPDKPEMTIGCMRTKTTDTHSEYVILIAFLRRQWLCERA